MPVKATQLKTLALLACQTGEPFHYPLTRRQASREIRRLLEIQRDRRAAARSDRSSVELVT